MMVVAMMVMIMICYIFNNGVHFVGDADGKVYNVAIDD